MFRTISTRLHILINFIIVVGLIAVSLLGLQYYFSQKLAISATHTNFTQTASQVVKMFKNGDTNIKNMLYFTELYPDLNVAPTDAKNMGTIDRFATSMQHLPSVYAMYIGHPKGDFFEVINMKSSPILHEHFKAPAKTRWTIIRIFDAPEGRIKDLTFLMLTCI